MNFVDFFAGIGGIRLGLEQAGHKCVGVTVNVARAIGEKLKEVEHE